MAVLWYLHCKCVDCVRQQKRYVPPIPKKASEGKRCIDCEASCTSNSPETCERKGADGSCLSIGTEHHVKGKREIQGPVRNPTAYLGETIGEPGYLSEENRKLLAKHCGKTPMRVAQELDEYEKENRDGRNKAVPASR